MIRDLQVSKDAAGFPIVAWTEDRNLASPEAMRRARVECRIMKDKDTGVLLFAARGTVRHGLFEEAKPWERLRAFSTHAADGLYYTKAQLELQHHIAGRGFGAKLALSDSAHVLLADFFDDTALHINCADAAPVDVERLHVELTREFLGKKDDYVGRACGGVFRWPVGDDRVMTYDPARPDWSDHGGRGILADALDWVFAASVVAAVAAFVVWEFGGFRR